jgi:hypothetical protein
MLQQSMMIPAMDDEHAPRRRSDVDLVHGIVLLQDLLDLCEVGLVFPPFGQPDAKSARGPVAQHRLG